MANFHKQYQPMTARPFQSDNAYLEVTPCEALRPYIKCFWGTREMIVQPGSKASGEELIIPDSCMDIIFDVNYTKNCLHNSFVGINNQPFLIAPQKGEEEVRSTFAIRFYAWTAVLFSSESMAEVKNNVFDVGHHYAKIKEAIEPLLFELTTMKERVEQAERILLQELKIRSLNPTAEAAVGCILMHKGNMKASSLAKEVFVSDRQLERVFKQYIGVTPKELASLVRYQYLWKDIMMNRQFNVMDAVQLYGYTDQSHLLNDFKKYHTCLPGVAKQFAYSKRNIE